MEPARINWQTLESVFVRDDTFENINAPQWVDFLYPDDQSSIDDVAWFCKPDCKHPKTAEDFLRSSPASKILRSVSVSKLVALGDWSRIREANLKRRVPPPQQDDENKNPNLATPISHQIKPEKAAIKSSAEKGRDLSEEFSEIPLHSEENPPKLKSVLSAKDLFAGRDLFGKITEFCTELKKLAIARAKEKEREDEPENLDKVDSFSKKSLLEAANNEQRALGDRLEKESRERKPFLELSKDSYESGVRSPLKEKPRKKVMRSDDDGENTPISVDLKNARGFKTMEASIRTSPPTPQCFSATREPVKSSKAPKSRFKERERFQEIQLKHILEKEEVGEKSNGRNHLPPLNAGKESRTLDVFWFFKPCAHSSTEMRKEKGTEQNRVRSQQ
ncbi:hypothetical protein V2J09_013241 [Rumex salicifolius]